MKQVWMLNHYALEPGGAGGTRHYNLAEALRPHGWQTSVIAGSLELNTGRQRLATGETRRLERFGETDFLWLRVPGYDGNGPARIWNMLSYTWRVLRRSTLQDLPKPDLIVGSTVHPFAALAGAVLARRHNVPFFYEVRDLWPQTLIDLGRLKERSVMAFVMRRIERYLFRRADRIVSLLPNMSMYTGALEIPSAKLLYIPNGVDLAAAGHPKKRERGDQPFSFMYFGAHGLANGLENLLEAWTLIEADPDRPPMQLRLIGDGPAKPALKAVAAKLGLKTVSFEDPVPKSAIPALAAEADAFVFNLVDAPVFRYGISSNKLFDFLAAGRPIVFACDAANNPVAEAEAGTTVLPGNPKALARAMVDMAALLPDEAEQFGQSGRRWVEANHSFTELGRKLALAMDEATAR